MELKNKRILITGGTSGLGFELANSLLKQGAHVFICSYSQEEVDKATIRLNSENVRAFLCDISKYSDIQKMAAEIPNLDGLINNAGIWLEGNVEAHTEEEISKTLDINLKGTVFVTNIFLNGLKRKEESFIVNISSTSGVDVNSNRAVYSASKWGVRGFTECLREDLKGGGVKVIGIYPSAMNTNLFNTAGITKDNSTFIEPSKIAEEIIHILEQDNTYLTDSIVFRRTKF